MRTQHKLITGGSALLFLLIVAWIVPPIREAGRNLLAEMGAAASSDDVAQASSNNVDQASGDNVDQASGDNAAQASSGDAAEASTTSGNRPKNSKRSTSIPSLPVAGVVVERAPLTLAVQASGRVQARRRAEVAPRVGERITAVHVREGQAVRKGQLLAELDSRPFQISMREAEAQLSNARTDYRVQLLGEEASSEERQQLVAHRSGLTGAEQALERAELDLESTKLVAPFDGVIARVEAALGEQVAANQTLFTLVDLKTLWVPARVLESDFGRLATGATAAETVASAAARPMAPSERSNAPGMLFVRRRSTAA